MSHSPERVLLLTFARRGEEQAIERARRLLLAQYPGCRILAIGTPTSAPVLRAMGVDELIIFRSGQSKRQVLREAARRRPKVAAIVYSGSTEGHLKLEVAALGSGAKRVCRCLSDDNPEVVGRLRLFWSVAVKAVRAGA